MAALAPAGDRAVAGIALMVAFVTVAPGIDLFAKLASAEATPPQTAFARFALQSLLLLPFMTFGGRLRLPPGRDLAIHAARGALLSGGTVFFFTALAAMPMADALAIFFVEPMILTLLSGLLLGEKVGWRRWLACAAGFGGAMLVIQPSLAAFGWVALAPVGSALCFAFYLILTRSIAPRTDPASMQFWAGLAGSAVVGAAILAGEAAGSGTFRAAAVSPTTLLYLLGVGAFATVSHLLLVAAFARARASTLAPFQYLEIVVNVALGFVVFGDFPAPVKLLGIAIIVGSGLVIFHRERLAERRAAALRPPA